MKGGGKNTNLPNVENGYRRVHVASHEGFAKMHRSKYKRGPSNPPLKSPPHESCHVYIHVATSPSIEMQLYRGEKNGPKV